MNRRAFFMALATIPFVRREAERIRVRVAYDEQYARLLRDQMRQAAAEIVSAERLKRIAEKMK